MKNLPLLLLSLSGFGFLLPSGLAHPFRSVNHRPLLDPTPALDESQAVASPRERANARRDQRLQAENYLSGSRTQLFSQADWVSPAGIDSPTPQLLSVHSQASSRPSLRAFLIELQEDAEDPDLRDSRLTEAALLPADSAEGGFQEFFSSEALNLSLQPRLDPALDADFERERDLPAGAVSRPLFPRPDVVPGTRERVFMFFPVTPRREGESQIFIPLEVSTGFQEPVRTPRSTVRIRQTP